MVSQAKRELAASYIGHTVGRMKAGKPVTQLHKAESAINDLVVMACGKQMRAEALKVDSAGGTSSGMAIAAYFPEDTPTCDVCFPIDDGTLADIAVEGTPG